MNENAKLWVKALMSGKYKQHHGALGKDRKAFCCLGVACEVYIKAGNSLSVRKTLDRTLYGGQDLSLPKKVQKWLGLRGSEGEHVTKCGANTLSYLNDTSRWTLRDIGEFIKTEPDELFVK